MSKHQFVDIRIPIEEDNVAIMRHEERCVKCGACKKVCTEEVSVGGHYDLEQTGDVPICVHCGQCANHCPVDCITEKYYYKDVKKAIEDPDKIVIFQTSPSVRVAIGEMFGHKPGEYMKDKMVSAIRALGADYVLDTVFGADLTITEEASELVDRLVNKTGPLPMFTSCCPAWVKFAEIYYPEIIPHISNTKSPISMQGPAIKTYFAKKMNIDPKKIVNVAVTPCTAKKFEISRPEKNDSAKYHNVEGMRDMDYIITTRELAKWMGEECIDFDSLKPDDYDSVMGEGAGGGIIFGNTGGVMEAALRSGYYYVTGKQPPKELLNFKPVRGLDGVKCATVDIAGTKLRVVVCQSLACARKMLDAWKTGEEKFDYMEVMNCVGGCIGGGGQPKTHIPPDKSIRMKRIKGLYAKDANMSLRNCHDNPEIIAAYDEFFEKPLSHIAEQLLHTENSSKAYLLTAGLKKKE